MYKHPVNGGFASICAAMKGDAKNMTEPATGHPGERPA
jgi:hypothetical protein